MVLFKVMKNMAEIIRNKNGDWKLKIMRNRVVEIRDDKKSITSVSRIKTREGMTDEEFNDFMELSMEQAENGESVSVDEAFEELFSIFK